MLDLTRSFHDIMFYLYLVGYGVQLSRVACAIHTRMCLISVFIYAHTNPGAAMLILFVVAETRDPEPANQLGIKLFYLTLL